MYFILSTSMDIIERNESVMARLSFIKDITGVVPTPWGIYKLTNSKREYLMCPTRDGLNGVYITGHNFEVFELCSEKKFKDIDFVVANTCVYRDELDTVILRMLTIQNADISLWYAKQDVEMTEDHIFRRTNTIRNVGTFGFMTSKSERLMYRNRSKGFMKALELSYDKVSSLYGVN